MYAVLRAGRRNRAGEGRWDVKRGTLAISWGAWGGCYVQRGYTWRVCVGWVALTYVPIELDDLCAGYIDHKRAEQQAQARDFVNRSREDCQPRVDNAGRK